MKLPLLVVAGPTGVGKTAAVVALGARVPLEVVSADSRQVYRFMDAATGKPTPAERRAVVHHLIDVVDPDDRYQAARFRRDAATAWAATLSAGHAADHDVVYVGLTMARDALRERLEARAAAMAEDGLAEEVEALLARGYDPGMSALQGIGYREFIRVARGELSVAS